MYLYSDENPRLIRLPEVQRMTGLSRSAIYKYMKIGTFPKSSKISERSAAWWEGDILEWMHEKMQSRSSSRANGGKNGE